MMSHTIKFALFQFRPPANFSVKNRQILKIATYLADFVWRREFNSRDMMCHLWSQIAEIYPVET